MVVVGAHHTTSSLMLSDRNFVDDEAAPEFLAGLERAGLAQCLALSTCDRVEIHAIHGSPDETAERAAATRERAVATGRRLGCQGVGYDELAASVAAHDIVIAAAGRCLISAELVATALERRRRKPIFIIDAAVPGDVEPAVERLDEAYCYDLDDLEGVAQRGLASRQGAAQLAWQILDEELDAFLRGRTERAAVPTLQCLRRRFEAAREEDPAPTDAAEATGLLINRLLHATSEALRRNAAGGALEAGTRRLFRLDLDEDSEDKEKPE